MAPLGLGAGFYRLGGHSQQVYKGGFRFEDSTAVQASDHNDFTIGWDKDDRDAAGMSIAITMKFMSWNGTTFGSGGIIGKTNEWAVHLTNGALYFAVHDESANKSQYWYLNKSSTEAAVLPNTYYHFVFRTGDNTKGIYIDGVDMSSGSGTMTGFVADENLSSILYIGKAQRLSQLSSSQTFSKIYVDDVVIWKSAALMTETQLQAYYNLGAKRDPLNDSGDYDISDDVVAYWDFKDLTDSSGNGHTLSLSDGYAKFI